MASCFPMPSLSKLNSLSHLQLRELCYPVSYVFPILLYHLCTVRLDTLMYLLNQTSQTDRPSHDRHSIRSFRRTDWHRNRHDTLC